MSPWRPALLGPDFVGHPHIRGRVVQEREIPTDPPLMDGVDLKQPAIAGFIGQVVRARLAPHDTERLLTRPIDRTNQVVVLARRRLGSHPCRK